MSAPVRHQGARHAPAITRRRSGGVRPGPRPAQAEDAPGMAGSADGPHAAFNTGRQARKAKRPSRPMPRAKGGTARSVRNISHAERFSLTNGVRRLESRRAIQTPRAGGWS